ncbi:MAG: sensor domain-containing diguanylate cyclase [Proteobacteria bacterium]|nr:sensor domain-containing diguanylate cyclase [Pseudomonadota bacterium]
MKEKDKTYETRALAACVEVGKLLTSTLNLKEILRLIVVKVSELVEAENWSLLLKDEKTGELSFSIVVGIDESLFKGIRLAPGEGIAGIVAETGEIKIIQDVHADTCFYRKVDETTGFTTRSVICVPLKTHGKVLGVLEIVNVKDTTFFESHYLRILTILSDYAAIAIENSHHCDRIFQLTIRDEYTGLFNARYLHQILDGIIDQGKGEERQLALVFVDIDNFKEVVDTYGHLLGSQVLKEVGNTMSDCIHGNDILVKYGGDEYIIILPDKNRSEAISCVETIIDTIRKTTYLASETKPVYITASFGIALYPDDASTSRDLLSRADNMMYTIKRSTKNGYGVA